MMMPVSNPQYSQTERTIIFTFKRLSAGLLVAYCRETAMYLSQSVS